MNQVVVFKAVGLAVLAALVCSQDVGAPCGADCLSPDEWSVAIQSSLAGDTPAGAAVSLRLRPVYEHRSYQPLWIAEGRLTRQATDVIDYLSKIQRRGLRPGDYDVATLASLPARLDSASTAVAQAHVDFLISLSLWQALMDLHWGRVDFRALGADLPAPEPVDFAPVVVAISRAEDVSRVIESVEPLYPEYAALIDMLAQYRILAADSGLRAPAQPSSAIRPGNSYAGVQDLARLLLALGDLPDARDTLSTTYDGPMVDAVRSFQSRHGLEPDGVLGRTTMAEVRRPLVDRVRQIEQSLERWRWLPRPAQRYIMVNVPAFQLQAFDREIDSIKPALTLRIIAGRAGRHRTPVFSAEMREVVFHPYWDVPLEIARREIVPAIRKDTAYLVRGGYEVVRGPGEDAEVLPVTGDHLAQVSSGSLRVRQRPGPGNALGVVKFILPNRHGVYLHDTPDRQLFSRARRDFSHGCVRVQGPRRLAEFVLRESTGWDSVGIQGIVESTRTTHVPIARPLTVFVQYFTATVDQGVIRFHPDLYGRDAVLARMLDSLSLTGAARH